MRDAGLARRNSIMELNYKFIRSSLKNNFELSCLCQNCYFDDYCIDTCELKCLPILLKRNIFGIPKKLYIDTRNIYYIDYGGSRVEKLILLRHNSIKYIYFSNYIRPSKQFAIKLLNLNIDLEVDGVF